MEVDPAHPAPAAGDELRRLLAATLSADKASMDAATAGLDGISAAGDPRFPIAVLAIAAGTLPLTTPVAPVRSCNFVPLPNTPLVTADFREARCFAAGKFSGSVHFQALGA